MKTMQGPALFLAQFASDDAPFNSLDSITKWAADCGYKGVQLPSWDARLMDLTKAAESKTYCDEIKGIAANNGIEITELSTHLQGQLVAVHPALASGTFTMRPTKWSFTSNGLRHSFTANHTARRRADLLPA